MTDVFRLLARRSQGLGHPEIIPQEIEPQWGQIGDKHAACVGFSASEQGYEGDEKVAFANHVPSRGCPRSSEVPQHRRNVMPRGCHSNESERESEGEE